MGISLSLVPKIAVYICKMQISAADFGDILSLYIKFVLRQSEFMFLCADFGWRIFNFYLKEDFCTTILEMLCPYKKPSTSTTIAQALNGSSLTVAKHAINARIAVNNLINRKRGKK